MDTVSKKKRSEIMSRVRGKDSKMELTVGRALSKAGLRYRKHVRSLPGTPDIAFIGNRVVVFLDSCFWHGCRWHGSMPKTNRFFWRKKLTDNKNRDKSVDRAYRKIGWKALRFWEHQIKGDVLKVVSQIRMALSPPEVESGRLSRRKPQD